jgi:hypothetical protein
MSSTRDTGQRVWLITGTSSGFGRVRLSRSTSYS